MKFAIPVTCSGCSNNFTVETHGSKDFPAATCPRCSSAILVVDPLSVSLVAERLLHRGRVELDAGDYTICIICSAVAIEVALTQVFLKWKGMKRADQLSASPSEAERSAWEDEYRKERRGGFKESANFVSCFVLDCDFDSFIATHLQDTDLAGLKMSSIEEKLFSRRKRILHWGQVDFQHEEAAAALNAAMNAFAVIKKIDSLKFEKWSETNRAGAGTVPSA